MTPSATLDEILFRRAAREPDAIAYRFHASRSEETVDLSMAAIERSVRSIGAALQARRLKGERVVLALPHAPEFLLAFYACLSAGALAVPVPGQRAGKSDPRFASVLADAGPALVIAEPATAPWLREVAAAHAEATGQAAPIVATLEDLAGDPAAFRRETIDADDIAIVQYTSGSTGDPKGVMISHGNFVANANLIIEKLRLGPSSRGVLWLPFYHDMGLVGAVITPMVVGGTADLMSPQAFVQSPATWLRKLSAVGATTAVAPNFALERCCDMATPEVVAGLDLSTITCLLTGSEPVNPNTIERFARTFAPCGFRADALLASYGLAESTLLVTGNLRDRAGPTIRGFETEALGANRAVPAVEGAAAQRLVGNGAPEGRVRIADVETDRALGEGEIGEILLTGASVARGYWGRPEVSAAAFGARLEDEPEAGPFYRTGDLGFLLGDDLFVTGRLKNLIIVRGRNLYPQDIEEAATRDLPDLSTGAAAAFAVDRGRGEEVVLLAEATRGGVAALKDGDAAASLVARVTKRLGEGLQITPAEICIVKPGRIPRTSSGKIQHGAARAEWRETGFEPHLVHRWIRPDPAVADPNAVPPAIATRGELEAWLVERLASHSGQAPHQVDLDEPFASYGLDSVTAIETIAAINALDLGARRVQPVDLYDYPTIQRLLDHMFDACEQAAPPPANETDDATPTDRDVDREAAALRALLDG
ncbi:AMP-binding protein [Aureimonas pseudogalii]|uniref:Acyl-CoA synthetase (AMP-forming)/AMP-acid ligase II n=1 Tax=Aureimonas pseudogalii TaxID=1744844 RepID=A0A7W6EEG6_9HYPH|nr:AMP-binding protein [Aureimonas pseudogalii]MBB3996733.1 acyl-CoA synthetase (AMP-forming)/AMP-acid ligase II [Aureimonas pseudogalii]